MPLTAEQRRQIDVAITAERRPQRGTSNRTTIATGAGAPGSNRYFVLADAAGKLTDAGRHYYERSGERPPKATYDRNQALVTRGANDYIVARNGREQLVRSLQADGTNQITRLGRDFFKDKHTEYIVHVPVIIEGRRAKGGGYTRSSTRGAGEQVYLPVSQLGLGQILESQAYTTQQAQARARARGAWAEDQSWENRVDGSGRRDVQL